MVNPIKVRLWNTDVGALYWDEQKNFGTFEYFNSFLSTKWNIAPVQMPLKASQNKIYSFPNLNEETFKGLPGLLSDVLPDDFGNLLINQWLKLNNISRSDFSPLDRLCYIGHRGMGALEFEPAKEPGKRASIPLEIDKLVTLSKKVLQDREQLNLNLEETQGLNELIKVGSSAGGQRAKAIIAFNEKTGEIRSGQIAAPSGFEHYLFKFDSVTNNELGDPAGYGKIEYAYYLMALDADIKMMPSRLYKEEGRAHFMTKRFDRLGNEKLHMQTLCSIAHFDYKKPGAYGYEDAFEIMRLLKLPHHDAVQLYKRMVFNVLARNQDDHTKNISFLMDMHGEWSLSPAYDVTYAYNPSGIWTGSHQMSINGKREDITYKDLAAVANEISYKHYDETINQIQHVLKNWPKYAEKAEIPEKQITQLQRTFRFNI